MPKVKRADDVEDQPEVPELNEDGLVPGQEVSFYELLRITSEARNASTKENDAS
jgi:hypothetical protein